MRILFDLLHPAQVRFFQGLIEVLRDEGHEIMAAARDKDETLALLEALDIPHTTLWPRAQTAPGMAVELVGRTARMLRLARQFRPDLLLAKAEVSFGVVSKVLGVPNIVFDDTEFAWLQIRLSEPLATVMCTGMGYGRIFPLHQLTYDAPPQLAYTHPRRFAPDPDVLRDHGIEPDEPYIVIRVKDWRAMHDLGVRGPAEEGIVRMAEAVRPHGRPVISTERTLPPELEGDLNPLPAEHALDLLAFARLYVGEGSSMAAEAGCLGTHAVYLSPSSRRGYLDAMEERYGHVTTVATVADAVARATAWLQSDDLASRGRAIHDRIVAECDDPVEFMLDVVRRYAPSGRS
jgi:predicted glycosyltransferase